MISSDNKLNINFICSDFNSKDSVLNNGNNNENPVNLNLSEQKEPTASSSPNIEHLALKASENQTYLKTEREVQAFRKHIIECGCHYINIAKKMNEDFKDLGRTYDPKKLGICYKAHFKKKFKGNASGRWSEDRKTFLLNCLEKTGEKWINIAHQMSDEFNTLYSVESIRRHCETYLPNRNDQASAYLKTEKEKEVFKKCIQESPYKYDTIANKMNRQLKDLGKTYDREQLKEYYNKFHEKETSKKSWNVLEDSRLLEFYKAKYKLNTIVEKMEKEFKQEYNVKQISDRRRKILKYQSSI